MTKKTSKSNPPTCSQLQYLKHRNRYLVELFCQGNSFQQDFCFLFKQNQHYEKKFQGREWQVQAAMQLPTRKVLLLFLFLVFVLFFFKENLTFKCLCLLWKQEAMSVNHAKCRFQRNTKKLFSTPQNNRGDNCQLTGNIDVWSI